jgi:hypothetical protein
MSYVKYIWKISGIPPLSFKENPDIILIFPLKWYWISCYVYELEYRIGDILVKER